MNDKAAQELAIVLGSVVRNSYLEDLHAGKFPESHCPNYSDVKVVSPYGEVPWSEISRLDDVEMKKLIKQIVNRIYTTLRYMNEPDVLIQLDFLQKLANDFDEPEIDEDFRTISRSVNLKNE
tara:strand:+ start:465 stop:830 length:366 start_codon:yes stop_codon:yes gene_type:complete